MNSDMMVDMDPLSSYEGHYEYPVPNPHFYPHPPHPTILDPYKNDQNLQNYPQLPYNPIPAVTTENAVQDNTSNATENKEIVNAKEEDVKPDIAAQVTVKKQRPRKLKGKTSSYWNKKITDKDFAFYGCAVCNIAYKEIHELDQHVIIHSNRMTSYDLRLINMKKRKRLKKKNKKKQKNNLKVKQEFDIDIKPEDGYIGTEKASEFNGDNDVKGAHTEVAKENNENNPVNTKNFNNPNYVNAYKCFGCNKQFALSYYLKIHVRSHTDEKPYTCMECGQCFITASKLGRHTKRIHLAIRHQCRICYKYFSRFELLVKHFDKKHEEAKLEGEPYDYNAILPYIKELEEQLRLEKEQKPKTEDPWDQPLVGGAAALSTVVKETPKLEEAKQEIFITKEEDKVIMPSNLQVLKENKDEIEMEHLSSNITVEEVKVDFSIKEEFDGDSGEQGNDDQPAVDDDDIKNEKDEGLDTDEEYFPSETWARSPSPLPETPTQPHRRCRPITCQICKKKLSSKSYLAVHMRTHTGEKPFSCYICKRGFITASKMHRHVLTHDESWEGKDAIKPEDDTEVKSETETEEIKTKKKKLKVDKAKTKLLLKKSKKTFFEKREKKNKKWTHACEFCNQKFLHLETLQVHKKCHDEGVEAMKCHYCLEPYSNKESLKEHEASHTGPRPYLCTLCGSSYTKRGTMVYHRKNRCKPGAADGKTFICDICKKAYNAHFKLQRHMITHSVSKFTFRYECPVCAHMFHTRYHVQMHLKSHMKEGLIQEENRNAILAMVLQNARKIPKSTDGTVSNVTDTIPKDERSRICNICGQIFQHFYYLEEHLKTHGSTIAIQDLDKEEEKKHTCQVCSKSFKLHYYLKLHSYTHTKEKPYICQQCGKGFITKGKLKRHIETHQGLKKYQCHICYKFFTRPSYMRIHVRTIHGTQDYHFKDYGIGEPLLGPLEYDP